MKVVDRTNNVIDTRSKEHTQQAFTTVDVCMYVFNVCEQPCIMRKLCLTSFPYWYGTLGIH